MLVKRPMAGTVGHACKGKGQVRQSSHEKNIKLDILVKAITKRNY